MNGSMLRQKQTADLFINFTRGIYRLVQGNHPSTASRRCIKFTLSGTPDEMLPFSRCFLLSFLAEMRHLDFQTGRDGSENTQQS